MGASNRARPLKTEEEFPGLWVDARLISKHLKQPLQGMVSQHMPASSDRLLHLADLALGTIGPDKFKAEKVSKKRQK